MKRMILALAMMLMIAVGAEAQNDAVSLKLSRENLEEALGFSGVGGNSTIMTFKPIEDIDTFGECVIMIGSKCYVYAYSVMDDSALFFSRKDDNTDVAVITASLTGHATGEVYLNFYKMVGKDKSPVLKVIQGINLQKMNKK